MLRRQRCPGSLALESTLPSKTGDEPDDEYQSEGRKLHALVANPSLPRDGLKPSQLELVESVERAEKEFLSRILQDKPATGCIQNTETTFPFFRDGEQVFTGTPDSVWVFKNPRVVAVADRKMGYKEVAGADCNLQLRTYIVMVADVYPAERYYGLITQPRVSSRPVTVEYTHADIIKARAEIETTWDACHAPNAPRRASNEACTFCDAKALCPEHKAWVGEIETARHLPVAQWTDAQMEMFEERRSAALKFIEGVHEQIKQIKAADPDRLPGYRLKDGAEVRHCTDLVAAWGALEFLLTQAAGKDAAKKFSACCSLKLGDLEDLLWELRRDTPQKISQKEAKRMVNQLLSDVLEKKRNKPSLVKDE